MTRSVIQTNDDARKNVRIGNFSIVAFCHSFVWHFRLWGACTASILNQSQSSRLCRYEKYVHVNMQLRVVHYRAYILCYLWFEDETKVIQCVCILLSFLHRVSTCPTLRVKKKGQKGTSGCLTYRGEMGDEHFFLYLIQDLSFSNVTEEWLEETKNR